MFACQFPGLAKSLVGIHPPVTVKATATVVRGRGPNDDPNSSAYLSTDQIDCSFVL